MHVLRPLAPLMLGALAVTGCQPPEDGNPPPVDQIPQTTTAGPMTSGSGTEGTGSSGTTVGVDGSGTTFGPVVTCEELECSGFGSCVVGPDGNAYCACDEGYVLDEETSTCVVDETCVRVRFLEDRCRQIYNGPPAVSLFFGVDFCAGTAVTPEKLAELGIEFVVLENGIDIAENVESDSTIIPTSVESYVTLAIDVSDSVTQSKELPALVAQIRELVTQLTPGPGDPDVYVSVYVFGRFVREYVPFTRDFASVDAALAQIETDPASVVSLVNGDGTALYHAVAKGIDRTQRIRELRDAVSWGGVLTTGTVVVITDGQDSSNANLDTGQIGETLNQVISIGISNDVDNADLDTIGRDGSFLAPTPEDWTVAFAEVAKRVDEYPDRAYLLAYCSSTTDGSPTVEVSLTADTKLLVEQTAECQFNAYVFSSDPGAECSQALFDNECLAQQCGGLTACGACADDQCCDGGSCEAPQSVDGMSLSCDGTDQLCNATSQICLDGGSCDTPDPVGGDCDPGCTPGEGWCDTSGMSPVCVSAFPLGTPCDDATPYQCQSLNCQPTNPDSPFEVPTCQLPALVFDRCDSGGTECEDGSYCQGSECKPKLLNAENCSQAANCRSGLCTQPVMTNICVGSGVCYWAWDEKSP